MNKLQQKAIAIVDETVDYYKTHPRAVESREYGSYCQYLTEDGKMCAVGRKLSRKQLEIAKDLSANADRLLCELEIKTLHSLGGYFWNKLQIIHDNKSNWIEGDPSSLEREVSSKGDIQIAELKTWILESTYKELKS